MSTCQQVITRALMKLGIVGADGTPNTADNALGLQALKAVYQKLINTGTFGQLIDVIPATTDYEAGENERVVNDGTITVTLPTQVPLYYTSNDYGLLAYSTDEMQVRPPRDGSVISVVNTDTGTVNDYIYDNRLREWIDINALVVGDNAPLSHRDENGLACLLARNVADEFGQQPTQLTMEDAYKFQTALSHNWSQAGDVVNRQDYY